MIPRSARRSRPQGSFVAACLITGSVALTATSGCGNQDRPIDPESRLSNAHPDEDEGAPASPEPGAFPEIVAAVGAVARRDAPTRLEGWLSASEQGRALLKGWPRNGDGTLDLDRAPLSTATVEAELEPGSKSKCGEVIVTYRTAGDGPALRFRLAVPATVPACRGRVRASRVHGKEAMPLLRAALADAKVPNDVDTLPRMAAN